ncbi:DUF4350 domain-containing protein [Candidatus Thorarchaeota archaeon]|nr:MAG: DUF4350 domain-containing protein [Candidatus Thorarchaeota archaeon]
MGWKEALQITLFILAWVPIGFLAVTTFSGGTGAYPQDFSVFNSDWNGLSDYRIQIEEQGYDVSVVQSTMSTVTRYDGNAVLFIIGPVRDFTIDATLTIFQHILAGGTVVIADDFGTANTSFSLLNEYLLDIIGAQYLEALGVDGFVSFADGVLLDLDSYDTTPKVPVIRDFVSHPLTEGVDSLYLNNATVLSPTSALGFAGIARTTSRAWCETNITDPNPSPNEGELSGVLPVVGAIDIGPFFEGAGKLVAISDPSIFINDMYGRFEGNRRLSMNIIDWATERVLNNTIIFSEQLLATPISSAEFFFGAFLGRIFWASTNLFLAPVYPLMTAIGIRKYLPDMKKPEVKSVSEVFMRRGQTYFSERMSYYRTEGNYGRVVRMLYRRLRRELQKQYHWSQFDPHDLWEILRHKMPNMDKDAFFEKIDRIEEIKSKSDIKIKEDEMMSLFFWMRDIQNKLIETK